MANGGVEEFDVAGPIEVKFKNRRCSIDAMVLPGDNEPLLGAIPMNDMDILMHPLFYKNAWAMVLCFSFFLSILYITLKKLSKAV